jgi:hypothetical protein
MVYNTQTYWASGLCTSSGVLKKLDNTTFRKLCFRPQVSDGTPTLLGLLERDNLNHWKTHQSHIATDGQSVSLGVEPHFGLMTRYLLLFDSQGLVFLGRPLWREDGSVFCIC